MKNTKSSTYLALGDSYTIGEGLAKKQTWPYLLANKLGWELPQVIATTGWKTYELIEAIEAAHLSQSYDWISLLIGVNNQYRELPFKVFQDDLHRLAKMIRPLVKDAGNIFIVSIPDYSVTPFVEDKDRERISLDLHTYNDYKEEFAQQQGFQFCYITDLSQQAAGNPGMIGDDKLHPSAEQYQMWVSRIIQSCGFHAHS